MFWSGQGDIGGGGDPLLTGVVLTMTLLAAYIITKILKAIYRRK